MKASELITLLQEQIKKHGDLDVCLEGADTEVIEHFNVRFEDLRDFEDANDEERYIKIWFN